MTSKEALEIIGNIDIDGRYPYPNFLKDRFHEEFNVLRKLVERDTPNINTKQVVELTSDEIIILKNVDKKYKYIARHRNNAGSLVVFEKEPNKGGRYYVRSDTNTDWSYIHAFNHIFKDITFESGAHLIADLIKENEK